jgi:hypothetical protein
MTPVTLITRSKWRRSGHERSSISIGGASSSQRCNEEGIESHCTVRRERLRTTTEIVGFVKDWEIIADNFSKAGWSWGCVSAIDREGRTIWIVDAHRGDRRRFIVHADSF